MFRNALPTGGLKILVAGGQDRDLLPRPHSEPPNHRGEAQHWSARAPLHSHGVEPKKIKVEYLGSTPVEPGSTDLGSLQVSKIYLNKT